MFLRTQFVSVFFVGCVALCGFLALAVAAAEDFLLIEVPTGIDLNHVQVYRGVTGSFGGVFGPLQQTGSGIKVPLITDNQIRAQTVKAVVYSSGCKFQTFAFDPIPESPVRARFDCQPLASIPLRGRIRGYAAPQEMEVRVYYGALWQMDFFGYADGILPQYLVATATPDASGAFQVDVPDFANDPVASKTSDTGSWDFRAYVRGDLVRLDPVRRGNMLRVQPSYHTEIEFTARP